MPRRKHSRDYKDRKKRKHRRSAKPEGGKKKKGDKKKKKDWLRPLNEKRARKLATQYAQYETGPQRRQIMGEIRASQRRSSREIPSWFKKYQQKISSLRGATQKVYDAAEKRVGDRGAAASAQDEKVRQNISSEEASSAALRGMPAEMDQGRTDPLAQANSARRSLNDSFASLVGATGANQYAYMSDKERIGKGEEIHQRLSEIARERSYGSDLRELARREGEAMALKMEDLRQSEIERRYADMEFADSQAGRDSQLALARQYGKNKRKEQKRGLRNQLRVGKQNRRNTRRSQNRSFKNQKGIAGINAANKRAEQNRSFSNQKAVARLNNRIDKLQDNRSTANQKKIARLNARLKRIQQNRSHRLWGKPGKKGRGGKRRKYGGPRL